MKSDVGDDGVKSRLGPITRVIAALVLIVAAVVVARVLHGRMGSKPNAEAVEASGKRQTPVVVTPATVRDFERSVVVQGTVEAKNLAMVSPRIGGTIEAIFVDEGDSVAAGQTKLFAVDQLNLEKAVQIAELALDVARSATQEKQANLERVEADFVKAELDYGRFQRLRDREAVTQDAFEQQESRYRQLQAMVKHARTLVELSKAQERQAEASLDIAKKNLADAVVYAPLDGKISERLQEPGETANPGHPILRIDDTSVIEVSAFLPSHYYAEVIPGQTAMNITIGRAEIRDLPTSYRSPTIHPRLRTFEVKCILKDPPEGVVPGAMADVTVVFEKRQGVGVPAAAIQQRTGKPVVFVVRDNTARQIAVKTGIESAGWMEILEGGLHPNVPVISMGQSSVEDGSPIVVQEE